MTHRHVYFASLADLVAIAVASVVEVVRDVRAAMKH